MAKHHIHMHATAGNVHEAAFKVEHVGFFRVKAKY
jgi:hypothetical protein